jgi:hypothetical protein
MEGGGGTPETQWADEGEAGEGEAGWGSLAEVALLRVMWWLGEGDLGRVGQVCRGWASAASSNLLWRPRCGSRWGIVLIPEDLPEDFPGPATPHPNEGDGGAREGRWKALYTAMWEEHGQFIGVYARVRGLWRRFGAWLRANGSRAVADALCPPATRDEVHALRALVPALPDALLCSLRIHNGQKVDRPSPGRCFGLLGVYSFYVCLPLSVFRGHSSAIFDSHRNTTSTCGSALWQK